MDKLISSFRKKNLEVIRIIGLVPYGIPLKKKIDVKFIVLEEKHQQAVFALKPKALRANRAYFTDFVSIVDKTHNLNENTKEKVNNTMTQLTTFTKRMKGANMLYQDHYLYHVRDNRTTLYMFVKDHHHRGAGFNVKKTKVKNPPSTVVNNNDDDANTTQEEIEYEYVYEYPENDGEEQDAENENEGEEIEGDVEEEEEVCEEEGIDNLEEEEEEEFEEEIQGDLEGDLECELGEEELDNFEEEEVDNFEEEEKEKEIEKKKNTVVPLPKKNKKQPKKEKEIAHDTEPTQEEIHNTKRVVYKKVPIPVCNGTNIDEEMFISMVSMFGKFLILSFPLTERLSSDLYYSLNVMKEKISQRIASSQKILSEYISTMAPRIKVVDASIRGSSSQYDNKKNIAFADMCNDMPTFFRTYLNLKRKDKDIRFSLNKCVMEI